MSRRFRWQEFRWSLRFFKAIATVSILIGALGGGLESAQAAENETLPHPLVFPLFLPDSPLQNTSFLSKPYKGDLPALLERRVIRVLVAFDRTNFFLKDGAPSGFEYDLIHQYGEHLKASIPKSQWPITFVFIPVHPDQLLPALISGLGDIAAAGLLVTPERAGQVDFTDPYIKDVREVLVTGPSDSQISSLDDLAGRRVYMSLASSHIENLEELSRHFQNTGRSGIEIVSLDRGFSDADIMELIQIGALDFTVTTAHRARFWAEIFPNIDVREKLTLSEGGQISWAVRRDSPELLKSLNEAIKQIGEGTLVGNVLLKRYFQETTDSGDPLSRSGSDRLSKLEPLFRRYAELYDFDWKLLAALAYQESGLDEKQRSKAGAVGIMQVLAETAAAKPISIPDITSIEANIHAGTKYLAYLRDHHFGNLRESPREQLDFVLASYNAGPTRIKRLQRDAKKMGLDPNMWFSSVENLARQAIGRETVEYVAKVQKYYLAYQLAWKTEDRNALNSVEEPTP